VAVDYLKSASSMTADVELNNVTIRFGSFTAVKAANFKINSGEFFSILGPSGCGKTTLLRAVSGFLEPSEGSIRIGGQDMVGKGPNQRPTALIFQNLALFPLMTVAENVAYGLRVRGINKSDREKKALELLHLVALPDQGHKRISELSGGQKQRVAIARALAVEPKVLLLDEPLSALDLRLRQHMRNELRAIQRRVGITFIYITHDQGEALTMSDRVAVMNAGVVEQIGDGRTIYDNPNTAFVASFVGENNGFDGKVTGRDGEVAEIETPLGRLRGRANGALKAGDPATIFIRPEALHLANTAHQLSAAIATTAFEGNATLVYLKGAGDQKITMSLGRREDNGALEAGRTLGLGYAVDQAVVLPRAGAA
jgi:spermidine/putrescine transport system ATP-binding protein